METKRRQVIEEDLANVEFETSEDVDVVPTFDSMNLREDLLRGIYAYGFEKPSAIQQRAIKPIVKVCSILYVSITFFPALFHFFSVIFSCPFF